MDTYTSNFVTFQLVCQGRVGNLGGGWGVCGGGGGGGGNIGYYVGHGMGNDQILYYIIL